MIRVHHSRGQYDVLFCSIRDALAGIDGSTFAVTDAAIARHYSHLLPSNTAILPRGERTKSVRYLERACEHLAEQGALRSSTILAIGGGVIGDLVGLVAATYMRGIPYIQVPTTLLAQVDSSIGGKVAIDLKAGKNLLGAFYPPSEVRVPIDALQTLPLRQFRNGMAEVIKYGAIEDPALLKPAAPNDLHLTNMVRRCIEIKRDIVQADEFETLGLRAKLNFGHTMGHAIEAVTGYRRLLHGEAVSIGMVWEARFAEAIGLAEPGTCQRIQGVLLEQGLPTELPKDLNTEDLIAMMKRDKRLSARNIFRSHL